MKETWQCNDWILGVDNVGGDQKYEQTNEIKLKNKNQWESSGLSDIRK